MPKNSFYAVRKGRKIGIFTDWPECKEQVEGFSGPEYKKFSSHAEAAAYLKGEHGSPECSLRGQKRTLASVSDESDCTVVYSDGACKGNGQPGSVAGVGVFWGPNDPRNIAERCPGDQTNNRAELIAIIRALETAPVDKKLLIKTDSQYSIKCFVDWLPKWRKNGYRTTNGAHVKNLGIIEYLSALLEQRGRRGQNVRLQYVKGHSGNPGNNGADALANLGATLSPRLDLDWTTLMARADEKIEALVPVKTCAVPMTGAIITHSSPESDERPTKLSKGSSSVFRDFTLTVPGQGKTFEKPLAPPYASGSTGSSKPTIYERHFHRAAPTPTHVSGPIYSPSPIDPQPHTSPANDLTSTVPTVPKSKNSPDPTITPRADTQSQHQKPDGQVNLPRPPRSPVKVSKVEPPLVPVSAKDIDFDLYKDCLLDGEEWEREIQSL